MRARWRVFAGAALVAAVCGTGLRHQQVKAAGEIAQPELIGEGVISTPDDELGGQISPDGKTLYFEKSATPHYLYIMCESHLIDGKWSAPEILPFSGQYRDTDPVLSPDGQWLLFASDRPVNGKDTHRWMIWRAHKRSDGWDEPRLVPGAVNSEGSQVFASIAANGNIYFASSRKTGGYDVFRAKLVDGGYPEAQELAILNAPGVYTFEATIAPDESYLLLGSFGRPGGLGSSDLFVSFHRDGEWSAPINLGATVNTTARDYSPRISADGKWMFFTSERGFLDEKQEDLTDYKRLTKDLNSIRNGLGNLYRVPLEPLLATARPKLPSKEKGAPGGS